MKLLLCNLRHYILSGPDRYFFEISEKFKSEGAKIVPFCVNYAKNRNTAYSDYFVQTLGDPAKDSYDELSLNPFEKLKFFSKYAYSFEAKSRIKQLIRQTAPDLTYMIHILDLLSPSIIDGCKACGIPVIHRLSDFHLICPARHFFRDGRICEECQAGFYNALKHSCVKNSLPITLGVVSSMYLHKWRKTYDKVDAFVTPSRFMKEKLVNVGFDEEKIHHIPSFVDVSKFQPCYEHEDYLLFFGRITKIKGIETLVKAWKEVNSRSTKLKIVGSSHDGEGIRLQEIVEAEKIRNVEFATAKHGSELEKTIQNCRFTIVPSLCYENTPYTIYESMAYGKPVVASDIGGIPEQIDHGINGLLFEPGNIVNLAKMISDLLEQPQAVVEMGKNARRKIEENYNAEVHYRNLMKVMRQILNRHKL